MPDRSRPPAECSGHRDCMVCGCHDPLELRLRIVEEGGGLRAVADLRPDLRGYDGILHGGIVSTLLDAIMTQCLIRRGVPALTAELRVRFLRPVPCPCRLELSARLTESRPPLYRASAELTRDGLVHARSTATFLDRSDRTSPELPVT